MNIFKQTYYCRYVISSLDDSLQLSYQKEPGRDNTDSATSSLNEIISTIKKRRQHVLAATLALMLVFIILACALTALLITPLAVLLVFVPAMIAGLVTGDYLFERKAFFVSLRYRLSMQDGSFFQSMADKVADLMLSDYVWHISAVTGNIDMKQYGASTELYERIPLRRNRKKPVWLLTDLEVPSLRHGAMSMYFFPDFILINKKNSFTALPYNELLVRYSEKAFIEYEFLPQDARIIRTTWLHPNRDNAPDRRFKVNPEIPVMLYGELTLSTYSGLHIRLLITDTDRAKAFSDQLGSQAGHYEAHPINPQPAEKTREHKTAGSGFTSTEEREQHYWEQRHKAYGRKKKARTGKQKITLNHHEPDAPHHVLGIPLNASEEEIKRAYWSLAKKFHPDRHTGKGLKETDLASEMFKKITRAYEMIKKKKKV